MSRTLPAPPPPLPPALTSKLITAPSRTPNNNSTQLSTCTWALEYPELHKACYLARVCEQRPPRKCQLRNVPGMLQTGPTCGLTALSMLLGGDPPPGQLLLAARQQKHTNNGEMFSAHNLFRLTCDNLAITTPATAASALAKECDSDRTGDGYARRAACQLHEGHFNCAKVRESLLAGACILVPYDPDFNHAPCLKYGHKAHWALIIGHLITDEDEFYVLARHGKTKNLAVWSLRALGDSNANLLEFAQPKGYPDCDFLLPPGGIGGRLGLRERAIIVNKLPQEIINIR